MIKIFKVDWYIQSGKIADLLKLGTVTSQWALSEEQMHLIKWQRHVTLESRVIYFYGKTFFKMKILCRKFQNGRKFDNYCQNCVRRPFLEPL